jgi:predicted DNA-binding transcriptional regulator YafY
MRRAARLFELIQRSRRLRVVTVRSLADIAICARHR